MRTKRIKRATKRHVSVKVPGSKSVTHRAMILAGLAEGTTVLINPLDSEDTRITAHALRMLGVDVGPIADSMIIHGTGGRLAGGDVKIFLKDSGTSMRFFTAVAALADGITVLTGSDRLKERPVGPLVDALNQLGAEVSCREDMYPPTYVRTSQIKGGRVMLDVEKSSQYLSALLIVAPYAQQSDMRIHVTSSISSKPYVDITVDIMREFGAEVEWVDDKTVWVSNKKRYQGRRFIVEGDCSSAAYFWAAAAILGTRVTTYNINSLTRQGDIRLLDVLEQMGCRVTWHQDSVTVEGGELRGIEVDMNLLPDQVPTLAVVAAHANGETVIRNVAHLRIKESDRLRAMAEGLSRTGIKVVENEDGLVIRGGVPSGGLIETYNDHRIAMSFAILGLKNGNIEIKNPCCANKSFPHFWRVLESFS